MTEVTAALVKQLRDDTGAGMMDCKQALSESEGDFATARAWLRAKGVVGAKKKASRAAAEGLIGIAVNGSRAAMVEVNAETDFVSRNSEFQDFVEQVASLALSTGEDVEALAATEMVNGRPVSEGVIEIAARVGENVVLRRTAVAEVKKGLIGTYIHGAVRPGLGRIGTMVSLEGGTDEAADQELVKQLAMHVAAARPTALTPDDIDPAVLESERAFLTKQAKQDNDKPDSIIEKMVEGRIRKFHADQALTAQAWVIDGKSKVSEVVKAAGKDLAITYFSCFVLGEGVEKKESNLADDVASALSE